MKTFLRILAFLAVLLIVFSIFIATRDSHYDVKRTRHIKAPTSVIYKQVTNFKTWGKWGPWIEMDTTIVLQYNEKFSGLDAGYSWTSKVDEAGSMKTVALEENKAIDQKLYFEKRSGSDVYWRFEKAQDGTTTTWGMKGELSFIEKAAFTAMGGAEEMFGKMLEKGLQNLELFTQKEMDKHIFTSKGIVEYRGGYFIHLTTECSFNEIEAEMDRMLPEVLIYAIKNRLPRAGAPFTLYHIYDEEKKIALFSCCVPVTERVELEGDIALASMHPGRYHKTTFQGNYKFSKEAWNKAFEYVKQEGFKIQKEGKPFEVYTQGHTDSENPADWVTEIYLPIE